MPASVGSRRACAVAGGCVVSFTMDAPGAARPATDYATGPRGGSASADADEVWLRGNVRPVLALGGLAVVGAAASAVTAVALGAGPAIVWSCVAVAVFAGLVAVALARAASGIRVGRRGHALVLRLSPRRVDVVPLAVVECVFPGSRPLAGTELGGDAVEDGDGPAGAEPPTRRVGTLVIRFAERAAEWRERPTFAAWGTWRDGHAIVDGRWCEPLSAEVARRIGARLLEAKREAVDASARGEAAASETAGAER